MSHFKMDDDGKYYQGRMEEETVKRSKYTESRKQNGLNGGRPRGSKNSREEQISDWDEMLNFFGNKCIKCGCEFTKPERPTKDHIIPKSWGGNDDICNLQPLCRECNASKCADNKDDYRLNYISDIPPHLKKKWIKSENHMVLLQKPYENHMGNGNDNSNKGVVGGKKTPTFDHAHKAYKCATYLDAKVCDLMPNKKAADEVTLQKWADAFDKTNRINGYEWDLIGEVLEFSQEDDFWKTNILSGDKFRKQFDQLYAKMRGRK